MITGELPFGVRHKSALMRTQVPYKIHQILIGIAFNIELSIRPGPHQHRQLPNVASTNMPLVWPRMHSNTIRSGLQAQRGRAGNARDSQVTRIAHQGDLVQVDGQGCTVCRCHVSKAIEDRSSFAGFAKFPPHNGNSAMCAIEVSVPPSQRRRRAAWS